MSHRRDSSTPRLRRHLQRRTRNERSFAMVWFALMLTVLVAFAGMGVDVAHWWYEGQREQQAADAASHGGVVYLPGDLPTAQLVARQVAAMNGFNDGILTNAPVNATVTVTQEPNPNRLRVKIKRTVPSFFLRLLGISDPDITRQAVAEYVAPVPMGSPQNKLGNDPENGFNPQTWLNIAGPKATKQSGDRFTAKDCTTLPAIYCNTSQSPNNYEYSTDGYFYTVNVKHTGSQPLHIDVYDPQMVYTGDYCDVNNMSTQQKTNLVNGMEGTTPITQYTDAFNRFQGGNQTSVGPPLVKAFSPPWCSGDQDINGHDLTTTFIFRGPDNTPWDNSDNPVISTSTCKPMSIPAFQPTSGTDIYNQLKTSSINLATEGGRTLTFGEMFHRFATLCSIPSAPAGNYVVQVRTTSSTSNPLQYDSSIATGGHNRFSIRAGFGTAGATALDGTDVAVYAGGRLPMFANATGSTPIFYLARIMPYDAGRTVRINLYDIGDAGRNGVPSTYGTLTIMPPAEYVTPTIGGCSFKRMSGADPSVNTSSSLVADPTTCSLSQVQASLGYNGALETIDVPIPPDYTCDSTSDTGCWFRIKEAFPEGTADTTTWTVSVLGNPVRLTQ